MHHGTRKRSDFAIEYLTIILPQHSRGRRGVMSVSDCFLIQIVVTMADMEYLPWHFQDGASSDTAYRLGRYGSWIIVYLVFL